MLRPDLLLATLGCLSPLLKLFRVGVVGKVHPVEHLPKVRVICPHALQGGVQLMITFWLGEPPQGLLLGQVVAFAHGLLPSSSAPSYRAQERWRTCCTPIPKERATGIACELRRDGVLRSSAQRHRVP